jgi:hypothetical protein
MRISAIFLLVCLFCAPPVTGCDDGGGADGDGDSDGDADGDGDADSDADSDCIRPEISTERLGETCGGDAGVECMSGQVCARETPSLPASPEVCQIGCTADCDCPSGFVCLYTEPQPGSPSPHCVGES